MIDRKPLLTDLQRLLKKIEADLRERSDEPEIAKVIKAEYDAAKSASRTADTFEAWRAAYITQIAAAWVLSTVFVRFLEDNQLIDPPKLSGPRERLQRARDEYDLYVRKEPSHSVREYLLSVFDELATLPGGKDVFGQHNPVHAQRAWISGDAAKELRNFWQQLSPGSGDVIHNFTDGNWDTRFLGDLYQDISEAARKKYALLQTPDFVEEFILDRTLEPALDEFGVNPPAIVNSKRDQIKQEGFRMIDPACGSGHFLLSAFPRILDRWQKREPGTNVRELVQRTLNSIHGVDINPYAIAIARFRLLLAALKASDVCRLADAPAFHMNLACGDSLYHGRGERQHMLDDDWTDESHYFHTENAESLRRILQEGTFHAVVANPPYIAPKDKAANKAYRRLYSSCSGQYALAVPFLQRIFQLATLGGFTGQITTNAFMKAEYGKKVVVEFLSTVDLKHVIDSAWAVLPGHGIPTVILLGRNQTPVASTVRTVMGIRGEDDPPDDPRKAAVWLEIVSGVDQPGELREFTHVVDFPRERFAKHPWSIGGGGAAELKERLEDERTCLKAVVDAISSICITREDEAYLVPVGLLLRRRIGTAYIRPSGQGEHVRDWGIEEGNAVLFPYNSKLKPVDSLTAPKVHRFLWPYKELLWRRKEMGGDHRQLGRTWWEWNRFLSHRFRPPECIAFAFVATHNHFSYSATEFVFHRTSPVIKLATNVVSDEVFGLLGTLNSSIACFWLKQVCFPKGGDTVGTDGARVRKTLWDIHYNFNTTPMLQLPLPVQHPGVVAYKIHQIAKAATESVAKLIEQFLRERNGGTSGASLKEYLNERCNVAGESFSEMKRLQEDLDWECYCLYGLLEEDLTYPVEESLGIQLGERAFEIVLARKMARGEVQTTWFERHGSQPITELPEHWPDDYKQLVHRRIEVIESNPQIALIEQPEYKRRWNTEPWDSQVARALKSWLLDRLESYFDFDGRMKDGLTQRRKGAKEEKSDQPDLCAFAPLREISLYSVARLADEAAKDPQFMEVAEVYRDRSDFDVVKLVAELVSEEHVPLLPILRYKPSGLDKRAASERTWELQRAEDAIDARIGKEGEDGLTEDQAKKLKQEEVGDIPVPPKYASKDFISTRGAKYWKLRGKLDVPKERWISFPHCEGEDQTLPIVWAGYDHLQQVQTISAYFAEIQEKGGSDDPRLVPLLGCIQQLIPWLKQWHNDIHPEFGYRLGDYFEGFVKVEARTLGLTVEDVHNWQPPKKAKKPKTSKTKAKP